MRGLKQQDQKYDDAQRMSHLLQMRGLKHEVANVYLSIIEVASFTDAWIETPNQAWTVTGKTKSHLLQMRGLKLVPQWRAFGVYVASFTDAWIETSCPQ